MQFGCGALSFIVLRKSRFFPTTMNLFAITTKCWPTWLQRLMLQRSFPIRSEASIHAWRLPYGVGWTRYSSTLPQLYLVYFSWVGLRPNLLWCNKDSIWESCNKFRCDWTLNLCINVLCVPAWSWDGTATQRLDRFRVGSLQRDSCVASYWIDTLVLKN